MIWFIVVSSGTIQGVFGDALEIDACRCADRVYVNTEMPVRVVKSDRKHKPKVGGKIAMPDVGNKRVIYWR